MSRKDPVLTAVYAVGLCTGLLLAYLDDWRNVVVVVISASIVGVCAGWNETRRGRQIRELQRKADRP